MKQLALRIGCILSTLQRYIEYQRIANNRNEHQRNSLMLIIIRFYYDLRFRNTVVVNIMFLH